MNLNELLAIAEAGQKPLGDEYDRTGARFDFGKVFTPELCAALVRVAMFNKLRADYCPSCGFTTEHREWCSFAALEALLGEAK